MRHRSDARFEIGDFTLKAARVYDGRMRLIVAITGSSGAIYGIRVLEALRAARKVEVHLVLSKGGMQTIGLETGRSIKSVQALADVVHSDQDLAATISSGSFKTAGMIVAPCSMKTLSGIVHSYADNLFPRASRISSTTAWGAYSTCSTSTAAR